jgi:pyruvate-formate lyase-activating enzyme
MADNDGISISVYGNSLFRLFYPKDIAALSIQRGSVGEIFSYDANRLEIDLVEVMTGSNFFCRYCNDPDIDSLTLSGASTAEFYRPSGVLKIGSLDSKQRSTLIFPDNECSNLEIITSNLVSDAKVYQGIDGSLVCD